ncbi:MAG: DUF6427 family protein [Bacteroidia bacterium]
MFIGPARQHQPYSIIFIILLGIGLWLPGFWVLPDVMTQVHMPLYAPIHAFGLNFPVWSRILALLLVLGEAFLIYRLIAQHQMLTKKSWLPALLFVVLTACTPQQLRLNAPLLANLFLLGAVHLINQSYRMDKAFGLVFNAGLLVGLGALIHFPLLIFVFFIFAAIIILRPFVWREWIILFLGVAVPFVYSAVYFFWNDSLRGISQQFIIQPLLNRDFFLKLPVHFYPLTFVLAVVLLAAAGRFITGAGTTTLKTKKGVSVMLWLLLFAILAVLLAQDYDITGFIYAAVPLSMFISNYFLLARRLWLAEVLFLMLLGGIVCGYLLP